MSTINLDNKTILVTGAAGFIGSNLVKRIYQEAPSATVVGIDNMNDYYDVALKEFRLKELAKYPTFTFVKGNIADKELITELFEKYKPSVVVNLAAQAGVRYSITNPDAYVESNLVGFFNILEACRHCESLEHLVYASSSSVYGSNKKVPYSTDEIAKYEEAAQFLKRSSPDGTIPTMKDLRAEKEKLLSIRTARYESYAYFKDYYHELQTACQNVDMILETEHTQQHSRTQPKRRHEPSL